ncbi:DNA polymerase beta superfamily protein [Streptomyces sp. NPDC020707]|uniref:Nucleotidyltransferase domain-containing protein n=1 Tax=Streptomyces ortus TaxID=2867268 RepID=A0ABT3UVT5_9ACTN|nr:nucleotidyltransferase domain-containing protein [Streptomyces ortus]MCX4231671.1 nucleotidyltransferase domain-containing protein [Streptomyces ortus]
MTAENVLLSGIVGSTAYGLARAGSDVDRLGMFAAPTEDFHGLRGPKETHVTTRPDNTLHEAAKWCRLALSGNPTVTELVWLPDELYEVRTPLGDELIGIRTTLLSAKRVRDAYLGYATGQFKRLYDRGNSSSSADTRGRTAKHARHLRRLCHQGFELYATGVLTVRVEDPDDYHRFGEQVAADAMVALPLLQRYEAAFDETRSVLPDQPDEAPAEAWLRRVRAAYYTRSGS